MVKMVRKRNYRKYRNYRKGMLKRSLKRNNFDGVPRFRATKRNMSRWG